MILKVQNNRKNSVTYFALIYENISSRTQIKYKKLRPKRYNMKGELFYNLQICKPLSLDSNLEAIK